MVWFSIIYNVLQFKQGPCLKPHSDLDTQQMAIAKNEYVKKTMSNAGFCKSTENNDQNWFTYQNS